MLYVLYKNSGCHSGRVLRKTLAGLYKKSVLGGFPNKLKADLRKREASIEAIVNLGVKTHYP